MGPLLSFELANTVTGLCTTMTGVVTLMLTAASHPQPARWWLVYWMWLVTGVFTVAYHGLGEGHTLKVLDNGTNLLLLTTIHNAILGDFAGPRLRRIGAGASAVINGLCVTLMAAVPSTTEVANGVNFGAWGGYMVGELLLITDAVVAVGLFWSFRARLPPRSAAFLGPCIGFFALGAALSTGGNDLILWRLLPVHAAWHIVGAFGFLFLWVWNDHRAAQATR